MNKLIVVTPYCSSDHHEAMRLLKWMEELDGHLNHSLILVADSAVPLENRIALRDAGKKLFDFSETIPLNACPPSINGNYHQPAAYMFLKAMGHINSCFKQPWVLVEPDAVPLKPGWLDDLADAYARCPKKFMGAITEPKQQDLPKTVMFATAVYPPDCYEDLKSFCDGKTKAYDIAFSDYVAPRALHTPLIQHVFGAPNDPPKFKEVKSTEDGPNVGTLASISKDAVLFHRQKDGSLIELLRKRNLGRLDQSFTPKLEEPPPADPSLILNPPIRRGPGRPPKQEPAQAVLQ